MKKLQYIAIISALLFTCEDAIDIDVPTAEPRLVIDASINYYNANPTENLIRLSLTSPFFDETTQTVSNAEVKIMDITNAAVFQYQYSINDGGYVSNFVPQFDIEYKLVITYNNEVYESTIENLIPTVPINNLTQGDGTLFGDDEKEVIINYTDDGSRNDFYLFDLDFKLFLVSDDEFYQGNTISFSYFYEDMFAGDNVDIKIIGIDQRHYNYMFTIINQTDDNASPFATIPTTVRGNITNITNPQNYPLGYFRLSQVYQSSITLE